MKSAYKKLGIALFTIVLVVLIVPEVSNTIERFILLTLAGLG